MARKRDKQPPKTKKYFRPTKAGAGMTKAGVAKYRLTIFSQLCSLFVMFEPGQHLSMFW